jgi:hypothetical protein
MCERVCVYVHVCASVYVRGDGREVMITDETHEAPFSLSAKNLATVDI